MKGRPSSSLVLLRAVISRDEFILDFELLNSLSTEMEWFLEGLNLWGSVGLLLRMLLSLSGVLLILFHRFVRVSIDFDESLNIFYWISIQHKISQPLLLCLLSIGQVCICR